jgi:hypothetical protein
MALAPFRRPIAEEDTMASYAFVNPIKPGKLEAWKGYVNEMKTTRNAELKASRKKIGLNQEKVWLQQTPMGDFAVVYFEADDVGRVFQAFVTSEEPFDRWFRDKVLVEVHGLDPTAPLPPLNPSIL